MSTGEYGNEVAEQESKKMERQQVIDTDLQNLRTLNYSDSEFLSKKKTMSELLEEAV